MEIGLPATREICHERTVGIGQPVAHHSGLALARLGSGWESLGEVPSEATFSRAFAAFAEDQLPLRIHDAMIKARYADKIAGHISRDATAIHAREKAVKKEPKPALQPAEAKTPVSPEPTRLQRQLERGLDENLAGLPQACDWGTRKDSKGKRQTWRGYKLHLDVADGDLPHPVPPCGGFAA